MLTLKTVFSPVHFYHHLMPISLPLPFPNYSTVVLGFLRPFLSLPFL